MDRARLQLNVLRNALYHAGQRRRYERYTRWSNFLVILLGASAMADLARLLDFPGGALLPGLLTTIVGGLQLVFDFGGKARDHQVLQRDYYTLLADIEDAPAADEAQIARFCAVMTRIATGEPPTLRALDARAYNDALSGLGHWSEGERLHIPLWHRIAGSVSAFDGYQYETLDERRVRRSVRDRLFSVKR
ncbi:hypothetical protein ACFOHH_00180 [Shinella pollutisoli]|uniref:SMODS and SLOG-associating 2TM effector domain-containing protein n=2 Tax=Shinella pollutisoli TaxID=2250594 RepID=A0ABV7D9F3_9HYPH